MSHALKQRGWRRSAAGCGWPGGATRELTSVLRRRLVIDHKVFGDRSSPTDLRAAWQCYVRSSLNWPFDHVVAARLLMWPARMLADRRPASAPTGPAHERAR